MKFLAVAFLGLFGSAVSQYSSGSGVVVTGPKTTTTTTVTKVAVPDFPTANVLSLGVGSTNEAVTESTIKTVIGNAFS